MIRWIREQAWHRDDPFDLTVVDRWPLMWRVRRIRCHLHEWREGLR
jgi:hypothetical protein